MTQGAATLTAVDRRNIALLCLVMFCSGTNLLVMTPILPQTARELHTSIGLASGWITAHTITTAVISLVFGPVSDRFGRRSILLAGLSVLVLGMFASSAAQGFRSMIAARALAGVGAGMLMTSTTSFVGDHFQDARRAIAMGYVMSGFFLSLILGMPLGAGLTGLFGWSRMFQVLGLIFVVALVLVAVWLPHPSAEKRLTELSIPSIVSTYFGLLKQRSVLGVLLMSAAVGMSMTMFSVYTSPWMEREFGLSTTERGFVYAVGGPAALIGGPLAGRLSNRFGRVAMIISGSLLMATMQLLIPASKPVADQVQDLLQSQGAQLPMFGRVMWPVVLPTLILFFFAMLAGATRSAPFQTLALEVVSPDQRGALSALRNGFNQAGSGLGASVGALIWANMSYPAVCTIASIITLVGVGLLRVLVRQPAPS